MTDLIIACVRTGEAHEFELVMKMRDSLAQHFKRPYRMVCLTDQRQRCPGVSFVDITALELHGWWGNMALFEPLWRDRAKVIYLDLNVRIMGDITPLADIAGEFAILESTARAINAFKYDSRVLMIGPGMCGFVWDKFDRWKVQLMVQHRGSGDRAVIEELYPSALLLQRLVPKGFFNSTLITPD